MTDVIFRQNDEEKEMHMRVPDGFLRGSATADFQYEGGWQEGGCGLSTGEMKKRYGHIYVDMDDKGNGTCARRKKLSYE